MPGAKLKSSAGPLMSCGIKTNVCRSNGIEQLVSQLTIH